MASESKERFSAYVKHEVDALQKMLAPKMKKSLLYGAIAIPLIISSVFNLYFLLVHVPSGAEMVWFLLLFAVLGAVGMALFKESKFLTNDMRSESYVYMQERVKNSSLLNQELIDRYIHDLQSEPKKAMDTFIMFLEHEERVKRLMNQ
ncbi:DUF5392 family protein [Salisediminibacterium halotolerans]|uniref:Uncharacterized protein n=1 Tax=Salisediminibacterium halotolerans TaxID=517425 RepID=A0A1H9UG24_9BACI|nr:MULTISPECIES: DUF5392 family protein [Salisediminibacterium]RLJ69258.1 hypothetical protein BCL39_2753 [Actinophytocola xinjiangensis]RPE87007.1 hypothetical protein EDD67_1871 [Salisediminibacterium halotolerans]TWG32260.1 hypothetical protein BCL52_2748 [Salisediminibacterium halotolerans]SES08013.1 hypothetical protein SAMN05444126_11416 [Salisediminibacterium haloalkalitolerans]GEL08001.1 hypothetical protein SHA02_14170 [Salisediminibacterium halotolerans]